MTADKSITKDYNCPGGALLRLIAGKWRPEIFKVIMEGPARFNNILRKLPGANKQSISAALRELEAYGMLVKETIRKKPLHIEYSLTDKGREAINIYKQVARLSGYQSA